jgi:beta-N-acetylhexosaminidase
MHMKFKKLFAVLLCAAMLLGMFTVAAGAEENAGTGRSPEEILEGMTTEEKISQMLMLSFQNFTDEKGNQQNVTEMRPEIAELLQKHGFAGLIFYGENLNDTEQAVRLMDAMQTANASAEGRTQLLTAVDQEGGQVARLGHGVRMPGSMALGAIGDPAAAEQAGRLIGEELQAIGLNMDNAPVVDVNSNPENPIIGVRSFSDDPALVAELGTAMMKGLQETGTIAVIKHFPGHGDTATDSHTGLPRIEKTLEELKTLELIPFQACIDAGAEVVMTAHIQYPQIESQTAVSTQTGEEINLPATLSKTILTDLLRDEMGFDGVVITDAMNMDAITEHFDPMEAARQTIEAGTDIILMPVNTSTPEGLAALEQYIGDVAAMVDEGSISAEKVDDAVLRILKLKEKHGLLEPYDAGDIEEKVAAALETVGSEEHHRLEAELAARALTLVKNEKDLLPLQNAEEKTLILVPYDSEVQSAGYALEMLRREGKLPDDADVQVAAYSGFSKADLEGVRHLIAVSATYGMKEIDPWTKDGAYSLLLDKVIAAVHEAGGDVTIVSAQLPYDADRYHAADAVVLAWFAKGMTEDPLTAEGTPAAYGPNLPVALMQILDKDGSFPGKLPVHIPALDEDGHFVGDTEPESGFRYVHDPRENPEAMKDIVENPDAVYGFSPDPESTRLGSYAQYDWTDQDLVASAREERIAYHVSLDSMTDLLYQMRDEGASMEEMARAVSAERNRLRLAAYENDPEGLVKVKQSNLETYGHEDGPTADEMYEKYGSWEAVLQKAFSANLGMDVCCGLYDEYYPLYIELGYAEP